jgi:hypothetical protein
LHSRIKEEKYEEEIRKNKKTIEKRKKIEK